MIIRSFVLAALLLVSSCTTVKSMITPTVEIERDLMAADAAFSALSARDGMAAAFKAYMDPREGMMIRPGGVSEGAAAIAQDMAGTPPDLGLTWTPDKAYAGASGDIGVTSGRFVRTLAGKPTAQGRYVTVWRRDAAGQWKALMDIGNTDPAPLQ